MRAAVMEGVGQPLVVRDLADPECALHGAIVRVESNGVCRSDWHGWVGDWNWNGIVFDFPHLLGPEFFGLVAEVGAAVTRCKPGGTNGSGPGPDSLPGSKFRPSIVNSSTWPKIMGNQRPATPFEASTTTFKCFGMSRKPSTKRR